MGISQVACLEKGEWRHGWLRPTEVNFVPILTH